MDALFTLDPTIIPVTYDYIVTQTEDVKFVLDTQVTSTETLATCPDIIFSVVNADLTPIDGDVFTYDPAEQTLSTYTMLQGKVGSYPMVLQAKYDGATYSVAGTHSFTVNLLDPCIEGVATATAVPQTNPPPYYYTTDSPLAEMQLDPYLLSSPFCVTTYSCQVLSGPRLDICPGFTDGTTVATFSSANGDYTFNSYDIVNYPAGDYVIEVTATVGPNSDSTTFTLQLSDPCPGLAPVIQPSPFVDAVSVLGDVEASQSYDVSTMAAPAGLIDCGPFDVRFYLDDGLKTSLDPGLFEQRAGAPD